MVPRLLAHNAEHWLSAHLNAYLRDDDEYRAIIRETSSVETSPSGSPAPCTLLTENWRSSPLSARLRLYWRGCRVPRRAVASAP